MVLLTKMSLAKLAVISFAVAGVITVVSMPEKDVERHMHGGFYTRTRVVNGRETDDTRTYDPSGRLINHEFSDMTGRKFSIDYDPETGELIQRRVTE